MPEWILLVPIAFPLVGALAFGAGAPRVSPRIHSVLPHLFLVLEIAAIAVNLAPFNHTLVISTWSLAKFSLALEMDGIASLLLLSTFLVLVPLWLVTPPRRLFDLPSVAILTAAILLILAANIATIYFAWVLLDLCLLTWRIARNIEAETALRAFALSQLAGLSLFAGAQFAGTIYAGSGNVLVTLALWARLGLFPFHWLYPNRGGESREFWIGRGVPLLAAASLWIRWSRLQSEMPVGLIVALSALAVIAAAVWVWREEQPSRIVAPGVWHAVVFIPLAIAFGGDAAIAYALWITLGTAFALAFFEMALRWRGENRNRWARILWLGGVFSMAGIPLTPAFLGRAGIYISLWESGQWWWLPVAFVATCLVLAPFWSFGLVLQGADPRDPSRSEYVSLVLIILECAALSFGSLLIAPALGPVVGNSAEGAIRTVIQTNDAVGVGVGFAVLVLPLLLSFSLRNRASEFRPQPRSLVPGTGRWFDLDWMERVVTGVGYEMGAAARNLSTLAEENPALWILLVALWVAIFVMLPR